ncbi:lactonase family protein [Glaciihabitans sp. INWT7]|uniref:lactonase family protein n=1 Tax=Glaciihabitans sp. INWT7 TaxID=2596912 RepID=UPI0016266856|nr:beta-propeller fold lactonase family protein [Glaciihabitans sp. INWT7]QNE47016.1 lactonase family protein [Glaciihabitans sp. INWT7]
MTTIDLLVGGYTGTMGDAKGISLLRWHGELARLELLETTPTSSPSFLASGSAGLVYATDEYGTGPAGRIEAFRRVRGSLRLLGGQPTSGGFPCHVSVTADRLFVSNYLDGSIDVFPLLPDGRIGELIQTLTSHGSGPDPVQERPHAHSTLVRGSTVLSADLGADRVHVQGIENGRLVRTASVALPPGTGPRDLARLAGRTILLGELRGSLFALGDRGEVLDAGTIAEDWVESDHAAGLAIDASARFLYTGLRGSNRIAVIRTGDLSPVATVSSDGDWPRHLCMIDGDVLLVANQLSSTVAAFRIDPVTGIPLPLGSPVEVASPTFLLPVL